MSRNEQNNSRQPLSFEFPVIGGAIRNVKFYQFFLLSIVALVGFELYSFSNDKGLIYSLLEKTDKIQLKQRHVKVKSIIKAWNQIDSVGNSSTEFFPQRSDVDIVLRGYDKFHYEDFNSVKLQVTYLLHLAQLQIIYTDITREPDEIFNSIKLLNIAKAYVEDNQQLKPEDIKYFNDLGIEKKIEWTLINASVFAFLSTGSGLEKYKKSAIERLNKLGGCKYLEKNEVKHLDILKVLGC